MAKSVPQIKPPELIPEGTYNCRITEIEEPKPHRARVGFYMLPISMLLTINGEEFKGFSYVSGYANAIMMMYRARYFWIGKHTKVRVRQREFDERLFNSFDLIWKEDWDSYDNQHPKA